MAKILALVISGPNQKPKALAGVNFARVAHENGAEVRVVFLAEGVQVALSQDPDIAGALEQLKERGVVPMVCRRILENTGAPLELPGFEVTYVGAELVRAVDQGFQVISF